MGNELSRGSEVHVPDSLWSVLRAEIARLDQGEYEMEVVCGDDEEYDIHQHIERCKKHPDHKDFIPVNKLTLNHIPDPWKEPAILAKIKHQCDLTVILVVRYTSPERPNSKRYNNLKGTTTARYGTGWINGRGLSGPPQLCQLEDCSFSSAPHKVSPFFEIQTAAHVIYDNSEARKTEIEFFYDDEKDSSRSSVMKAEGVNISSMDLDGDVCHINCVTHDPDWNHTFKRLTQMPKDTYTVQNSPLSYIISHPHGGSKQVTFGDVTHTEHLYTYSKEEVEKLKEEHESEVGIKCEFQNMTVCKFKYNIPTCPGSSGAPMITIRPIRGIATFCTAPHSRHKKAEQVNESGAGAVNF